VARARSSIYRSPATVFRLRELVAGPEKAARDPDRGTGGPKRSHYYVDSRAEHPRPRTIEVGPGHHDVAFVLFAARQRLGGVEHPDVVIELLVNRGRLRGLRSDWTCRRQEMNGDRLKPVASRPQSSIRIPALVDQMFCKRAVKPAFTER
jgi:hypothetical protein